MPARDVFTRRHTNIRDGIGEARLQAEQREAATTSGEGDAAMVEVPFELKRTLAIFGEVSESNALRLVQNNNAWKCVVPDRQKRERRFLHGQRFRTVTAP